MIKQIRGINEVPKDQYFYAVKNAIVAFRFFNPMVLSDTQFQELKILCKDQDQPVPFVQVAPFPSESVVEYVATMLGCLAWRDYNERLPGAR